MGMKNGKHAKACFLFKERLDVQRLILGVDFLTKLLYNLYRNVIVQNNYKVPLEGDFFRCVPMLGTLLRVKVPNLP